MSLKIDQLIDKMIEKDEESFEELEKIYRFLRKQITKARLIDIADDKALENAISELSDFIEAIQTKRRVKLLNILPSLEIIRKHLEDSDKIDHQDDKIYQDLHQRYNITID